MELSVEIGRTHMTVGETLDLRVGSVVTLERLAGETADLLVNGSAIARGEVVVIDEQYGLRITEILDGAADGEPAPTSAGGDEPPRHPPGLPAPRAPAAGRAGAPDGDAPGAPACAPGCARAWRARTRERRRRRQAAAREPPSPTRPSRRRRGASPRPPRPPRQVRALDFSQPTKFTTELRRRIARALDGFCEALGGSLGGELNAEVEVAVGEISQHTWAAAKAQLPADSIAVAVEAETIRGTC